MSLISTAELSELLVDLYAAPLKTKGWQVFFDGLCNQTQLSVGYLICHRLGGLNFVLAGGGPNFESESINLYHKHYRANDPYRAPLDANPRAGAIQGEELVSRSRFLRSELYNDLMSRHDAEFLTVLTSHSGRESTDVFSLWRSRNQGPMDGATLQQLEMLVPHMRNAFALHAQISDAHSFRLLSETVMESMSIAALQVARNGRVKYANQLAESYLRDGDGLRQRDGFVSAIDPEQDQKLHALIANATRDSSADSRSAPGGALQVSRRKTTSNFQVTVVPAPKEHRLSYFEPTALIFVADPALPARSRSSVLKQLYGLTPTETKLVDTLVQGFEVREAAERLSMTYETARFNLKRIMAKTGARRQAELIQLTLSLPGQGGILIA